MFYSYLFSNDLSDLDELPSDPVFVILSQDGYLRCTGQNVKLLPMVKAHIAQGIIKGDKHSGCHYFLMSSVIPAGRERAEILLKRLGKEIQHGTTYSTLLNCQRVINTHFEEAIATLIEAVTDDNHALNARIFSQIADNYAVLASFNPRYRAKMVEWEQKVCTYRALFCKEKELVNVTLR